MARVFAVDEWVHIHLAGRFHLGRIVDRVYSGVRYRVRWRVRKGLREDTFHWQVLEHYTPTDEELAEWIEAELTK